MNDLVVTEPAAPAAAAEPMVFSFGDPEPVNSRRDLLCLDHMASWSNGRWYEPPISLAGLSRTRHASPHHASAMQVKVNLLASTFIPHPKLSRQTFKAVALDYLVLANLYLEPRKALSGRSIRFERSPAKYTRRGLDLDQYYFLTPGALGGQAEHVYDKGAICHLLEPDLDQEIYGTPEYLSALQAAWLNEAATIFRRRYYENGSHAGFILYATDQQFQEKDAAALRQALKDSKGPGNFRNLFIYAPGGKKDGLNLIPVSEVAAKDEFMNIKSVSRDDVLAAHRAPPQLVGVVPANAGGFGDVAKTTDVFVRLEIQPLQNVFRGINDWAGEEIVRFDEWEPLSKPAGAAAGA